MPSPTYHLSCRGEDHPNPHSCVAPFCAFCPAFTVQIFQTSFLKTVVNRRSKIIKGPISAGSFVLNFLCTVLLLIFTHQFLSASYLRNIVSQFMNLCSLKAFISKKWNMDGTLPSFATISITGYKLATSVLKDIIYFCPFLKMEGTFSYCNDHIMASLWERRKKSKPALWQS